MIEIKRKMFSKYADDVEEIDISGQRLTSLPDLSRFKNLKRFNCSNNQLTHLPSLPSILQRLECSWNQLTHLPLLPSTLQILECYNNQLIMRTF